MPYKCACIHRGKKTPLLIGMLSEGAKMLDLAEKDFKTGIKDTFLKLIETTWTTMDDCGRIGEWRWRWKSV